jgi:hypothetical protein
LNQEVWIWWAESKLHSHSMDPWWATFIGLAFMSVY